ncbi:hypothetical protein G6F68_015925 [Rhizopus microsporus]|nr:hypothetical protein G6F68_015925 [Rhizopus microsporus]
MIERHPDNVAAALMGGFVASYLRELDPSAMQGVPASESLLDIALSQQVPQPPVVPSCHCQGKSCSSYTI